MLFAPGRHGRLDIVTRERGSELPKQLAQGLVMLQQAGHADDIKVMIGLRVVRGLVLSAPADEPVTRPVPSWSMRPFLAVGAVATALRAAHHRWAALPQGTGEALARLRDQALELLNEPPRPSLGAGLSPESGCQAMSPGRGEPAVIRCDVRAASRSKTSWAACA